MAAAWARSFVFYRACSSASPLPPEASPAPASLRMSSDRPQNKLVLMRHGESMWNDLKLFTGLVRSKQTALIAMTQSRYKRVPVLVRGGFHGSGKAGDANRLRLRDAAAKALEHASCLMVPVYADPALNERCYGDLQGLSKEAAIKEFGEETVKLWRRSYDTRPPYGESLKDTAQRTIGFFKGTIVPRLEEGRNVLIVAHGNVLRCIISHLAGLSETEMLQLQILTGLPYAYAFDGALFAECCVLPPLDPTTNTPKEGVPRGMTSVIKMVEIDSLI